MIGRCLAVVLQLVVCSAVAGADAPPTPTPAPDTSRPRFAGATEVVASRLTGDAAALGRRLLVVTREEIRALPVHSVQDLLAMLPGLGLSRRGARGVQGDLSLRGGTFEQTAVLVNGVRVNNPQTGHHNLDLFLPVASIERIEVLYGPGSAVHGPGAFGGAINIVTGEPARSAFLRVGSNNLAGGGVAGTFGPAWLAAEREVHTGFRDDTEADVNQLAGGWSWHRGRAEVAVTAAAGSRSFGAWSFYSTRFPLERESTDGALITATASAPVGRLRLDAALRLDRHNDDFVLDRTRPDWYRNRHRTDGALIDLALRGRLSGWDWAAGVEAARDEIDSTNLGRHHRSRTAGFVELGRTSDRWTFGVQLRHDWQQPWGAVGTVAAGGSWRPTAAWRLRAHHGQSFRAPSFTELYYTSPSTVGNPELGPERGRTSELGVESGPWSATLFERRAHPLIDYLLDDDGVWRATTLGKVTTRGVEAAVLLPAVGPLRWQRLGAVWLTSSLEVDPERSAYALAHPRLEAAWTGSVDAGKGWQAGWAVRFRDPRNRGSWATLDLRLERRMLDSMVIALQADNVFDREVSELHGIPLPGRWLSLTVTWQEQTP